MLFMGELNENNIDEIAEKLRFTILSIASVEIFSDCILGRIPYDKKVKDAAMYAINGGCNIIWVQCLANGNLEMADDVYKEAKMHYDIWAKEQGINQ